MRDGFHVERRELAGEALAIAGLAAALVVHGELRARPCEGESSRLAAGDVLVIAAGSGSALAPAGGRSEVILFRAQAGWLAGALALAGFEPEPPPSRAAVLRAGTPAARRAGQQLRVLAQAAAASEAAEPLARAARALDLLAVALAARGVAPTPSARRASPRAAALERALEALAEAPLQDLTLACFAARLGFSQRQASRLVRERLGCSFGEHVAALRLGRAERLLIESELPVIEVAGESGFGSLAHFNQRFRARTGRTPSAYRAAMRRPHATPPRPPAPA
jgi:AraC-like DNA-binding protein